MGEMVKYQENGVDNFVDLSALGLYMPKADENEMEDEEEAPTHLNTINSSGGFVVVSVDKLSVQYTSVNMHGHDVGVIQANRPAPTRMLVYYFEMYVKSAGQKGQMSIGFTNENYKMRRQPGWDTNSYGYHGDDGMLYHGQGKGENFGPTFTSGDTVGGGINYVTQEIFFTKNGELIGQVPKDVKGALFPTVAVHSQNEEVNVNFGKKPFVFDIKEFISEERSKQDMTIDKTVLPPNISHGIVRSYLIHYGYQDTLNSFDLESKSTLPPVIGTHENGFSEQGDMYALGHRKVLRQLIRSGDIDGAFCKLREWYPQIVQNDTSNICFLLHCQKFIELVQVNLEEAVKYAKAELGKFCGITSLSSILQDCIALLAYEDPLKSPVAYLLDVSQREVAADAVNTMVLLTNPEMKDTQQNVKRSGLETLLRQLTACCLERRALNGGQGESFDLHRVVEKVKGGKR